MYTKKGLSMSVQSNLKSATFPANRDGYRDAYQWCCDIASQLSTNPKNQDVQIQIFIDDNLEGMYNAQISWEFRWNQQ